MKKRDQSAAAKKAWDKRGRGRKHPNYGRSYYHGTSVPSASRLRRHGIKADQVFFATDRPEDAIGSDDDDAVVRVQARLRQPLDVTIPPLGPNESVPSSVGNQVFREARRSLGIKFTQEERDAGETPVSFTLRELRARGYDGIYVDLPQLREQWVVAWEPDAVEVVPAPKPPAGKTLAQIERESR